jgi:hypothetical protein
MNFVWRVNRAPSQGHKPVKLASLYIKGKTYNRTILRSNLSIVITPYMVKHIIPGLVAQPRQGFVTVCGSERVHEYKCVYALSYIVIGVHAYTRERQNMCEHA